MRHEANKPNTQEMALKNLKRSVALLLLYAGSVLLLLWLAFTDKTTTSFIGLFFQLLATYLLYIEERYMMDHDSMKFGKYYTVLWTVLKTPSDIVRDYRTYIRWKTGVYIKDNPNRNLVSIDVKVKLIDFKSDKDEDRLNAIESNIRMLSQFSYVKRTAYICLAIGFILQFYNTII